MTDGPKLTFKGGDELDQALAELDARAARRVGLAALRAGAKPIKRAAKARAPVRTTDRERVIRLGAKSTRTRSHGFLKRTIIYRTVRGELRVRIGPRRAAFYGQLFERGRAGRPMPRNRFLSSAFRAQRFVALERMSRAAWVQLVKEVDRIAV